MSDEKVERPGVWADGIGWIAPFDALDGEDRIVHDWSERVIKVREDFFGYEQPHVVVVLRWADGTIPGADL